MKFRTIASAATVVFVAPSAFACPDGSLQETVNLMVSVGQHGESIDVDETSTAIDDHAAECQTNPYVLKVAALARATLADVADDRVDRVKIREQALADFDRSASLASVGAPSELVMINGQAMAIGFSDTVELRAALVAALDEDR